MDQFESRTKWLVTCEYFLLCDSKLTIFDTFSDILEIKQLINESTDKSSV